MLVLWSTLLESYCIRFDQNLVEGMMLSLGLIAYLTHFSSFFFQVFVEVRRTFANGKLHFYSFMEFYVIQLKNKQGKI